MPITQPFWCACGLIRQLLQARTLVKVVAFPRPAVVNGASATGFPPRGITLRGGTMRTRPNAVWLHGDTLLLLLANFQQARNASVVLSSRDSGSTVGLLLQCVLRINNSFDTNACTVSGKRHRKYFVSKILFNHFHMLKRHRLDPP